MLPQYEATSLIQILEKLAKEVAAKDWDQIKFQAHALKGPAGYIGASRLHYACYWIQRAHVEGDYQTMLEYYPLVIETAIELRFQVRVLLAKFDGRGNFPLLVTFTFRGGSCFST